MIKHQTNKIRVYKPKSGKRELNLQSKHLRQCLAEANIKNGQINLAIKNYKKSLELNPDNENAKEMLNKLK